MQTSPTMRRMGGEIAAQGRAAAYMDLAVRGLRVLARAVVRAIELGDIVPPSIAVALQQIAGATEGLGAELVGDTRHTEPRAPLLLAIAASATALEEHGSLSVAAIVGQIRSTATELLSALGDREQDAHPAVGVAARELDHTSAHLGTVSSTPIGA